jgi:hypothetical protein
VRAILLSLLLCASGAAHAERYRVDLIVFADKSGVAGEAPTAVQAVNTKGALEPYDATALRAAGIEVLPDEQFGLSTLWGHLRNSRNHQPLLRLAWLQKDPPADKGIPLHLHYGTAFSALSAAGSTAVYPVDGTVALLAGHFLHIDADLVSTQASGGGDLVSYRLHEKRRVKRDELHHLDSPKLGVLVQVTRVDVAAKPKKEKKK